MSTDSHLAFAHPEERAEATASADPRDRISLRDYQVEAEIGAFQTERGLTQRLMFNVVVEVVPQTGPVDDDVDRIMSYDRITEAISDELALGRLNLLETLAEHVAERILAAPQAMRVFVRIEKLDRGPFKLGVDIVRTRAAQPVQAQTAEGGALHPLVVFVDNQTMAAPDLNARIAALEARGLPVVLCVGLPVSKVEQVGIAAVQRRIDLLAIETNAWVLASRDRDWLVVEFAHRNRLGDPAGQHDCLGAVKAGAGCLGWPDRPRGKWPGAGALAGGVIGRHRADHARGRTGIGWKPRAG